jgi:oligopeptide/dipeptide ABC transporter ATP-binding protein
VSEISDSPEFLLCVEGLTVEVPFNAGRATAVKDVSLTVRGGRTVVLLGESGGGKSLIAQAIGGILPRGCRIVAGRIVDEHGEEFADHHNRTLLGGERKAMVMQDPQSSLIPTYNILQHFREVLRGVSDRRSVRDRACELLLQVGISSPSDRLGSFPHEFSGGMQQRVNIALAIARSPKLLIADESTTALDVTIQLQVLRIFKKLQAETGMAILLITHDISVAQAIADDLYVLYSGRIVERGRAADVLDAPSHPYTQALLAAAPSITSRSFPVAIPGMPPRLDELTEGCEYAQRCRYATSQCLADRPALASLSPRQSAACWYADGVKAGTQRHTQFLEVARGGGNG